MEDDRVRLSHHGNSGHGHYLRSHAVDMSPFNFGSKSRQSLINLHLQPQLRTCWHSAPAPQAYVEGIFFASGLVSSGRMNRMGKSLETSTWIKVNAAPLRNIGFLCSE